MGLFTKTESFLGIDLGAGSIKLVELKAEQGRPRLVTYGLYELPIESTPENDWTKKRNQAVQALKDLLVQCKAQSNLAVSALPTFAVFSSIISVPPVPPKELQNAIRLEAKKVVPRPIEEMILDWKEIHSPQKSTSGEESEESIGKISSLKQGEQKKMLITAAPKDWVDSYVSIFKDAGVRLVSLETESLALSRSLVGKDPAVIMVVDMGARTTNLAVVEQGIPVVNRAVSFAGSHFTQELSKRLGLSLTQAENWKRDLSLVQERNLLPAMREILDDVLHEIQYLFQLYRRQFSYGVTQGSSIEKVVLTGGSAFVPGLAPALAQMLNVPVHIGDPWARVVYPEDLRMTLSQNGPSLSVAVGLAMRHILK